MKLYFKNSKQNYRLIGEVKDIDSGIAMALEDLRTNYPHFKSYYQRVWTDDNGVTWIDVGSWTEYYVIKEDICQ